MSGATVTLINPATNQQRVVNTNAAGIYTLPALLPGTYNLKVEMQGFTTQARNNVELQVARLDFTCRAEVALLTWGGREPASAGSSLGCLKAAAGLRACPARGWLPHRCVPRGQGSPSISS